MNGDEQLRVKLIGETLDFIADGLSEHTDDASLLRAQQDGFEIDGVIQAGQWFSVYRGENETGLEVIIKCPAGSKSQRERAAAQLADEHRILQSIKHDAVVQTAGYAPGPEGYLATVFEGDRDLVEWVHATKPTRRSLIHILTQFVKALAALHDAGVVHGDLKPQHVVIRDDGTPVLIDFGLAERWRDIDRSIQTSHRIGGTSHYMPPEIAERQVERPDPRQDVFACGHIFKESFEAAGLTLGKLMRVVERLIAIDPHDRLPNAAAILEVMHSAQRPRRWPVVALAAVICAFISGTMFLVLSGPGEPFVKEQPDSMPYGEKPYGEATYVRLPRVAASTELLVWAGPEGQVSVSDTGTDSVFSSSVPSEIRGIDHSSQLIVLTCFDGTVQLMTHELETVAAISLEDPVRAAKLSSSEQAVHCWVAATSSFVTVSIDGAVLRSLPIAADYIVWDSTNHDHVIAAGGGGITLVDLRTGTVDKVPLDNTTAITAADYDDADGAIALGLADGQVLFFDGDSWTSHDIQVASPIAAIHAAGYVAVSGEVKALDWKRQRVLGRFGKPTSGVAEMQLLINERTMTVVSSSGVSRWDIEPSH